MLMTAEFVFHLINFTSQFIHDVCKLYKLAMLAVVAYVFEQSFEGGHHDCTLLPVGDDAVKLDGARLSCQGRYFPQVLHSSSSSFSLPPSLLLFLCLSECWPPSLLLAPSITVYYSI